MQFEEKYSEIINPVKSEIDSVIKNLTCKTTLQEPLHSKVLAILKAPSKHIRAVVSFLYLKSAGENIDDKQILYQTAIELVHNASLIHDDIIDESKKRRGISTINSELGNKLAVIAGDYLLSSALDKVLQIGKVELVQMFSDTLKIMCNGEVSQHFSRFKIPKIDEYIEKSYQKTAKLFETAVCGSLLISGSKVDGHEFAKNFGIAFQIRDDLINCKTSKTDIKEGIYTAPIIFSNNNEMSKDGIEKTKILLSNYIDKAQMQIENFDESKYKSALKELLGLIKNE